MTKNVKNKVEKEVKKARSNVGIDGLCCFLAIMGFVTLGNGALATETMHTPAQKKVVYTKIALGGGCLLGGATISAFSKKSRSR